MSTPEKQYRKVEDVENRAKSLSAQIPYAQTPEQLRALLDSLEQLATSSPSVASYIEAARAAASERLSTINAEKLEQTKQQVAKLDAAQRYAIDANKEPLAASIERLGLWTKNEKKYLESLEPGGVRKGVKFDDNGQAISLSFDQSGKPISETIDLRNDDLRAALPLIKAYSEGEKLDEDARKQLNKILYGQDTEPTDGKARAAALEKIKDAAKNLAADSAAHANTQQEFEKVQRNLQETLKGITELQRLQNGKDALPEPMKAAAQQHIDEQTIKNRRQSKQLLNDLVGDDALEQVPVAATKEKQPELNAAEKKQTFAYNEVSRGDSGQILPSTPAGGAPIGRSVGSSIT